ncbi:MAG: hypothetical protein ACXVGB_00235 [Mycobacteriaceae bacterium]
MLSDYTTDHPGKFERVPAIVRYIHEHDAFDQESGDVQAPTGWFARAGRWVIGEDERGAVDAVRFATRAEAQDLFESLDLMFGEWAEQYEDAWS